MQFGAGTEIYIRIQGITGQQILLLGQRRFQGMRNMGTNPKSASVLAIRPQSKYILHDQRISRY